MKKRSKIRDPYFVEFRIVDVAYAFGLSLLPTLVLMIGQSTLFEGLSNLPFNYFLFAVSPFLTLLSVWHPFIAIPIFIMLFAIAIVVQRRALKIILMALLFIVWQGYGMLCISQHVRFPLLF